MMNPYELVKELIKKGYDINLVKLDSIIFIIRETGCKSIEDWDKIQLYLKKYTEETRKTMPLWQEESTFQMYIDYLECFKGFKKDIFPVQDMYQLMRVMEKKKEEVNKKIKESLNEEVVNEVANDRFLEKFEVRL